MTARRIARFYKTVGVAEEGGRHLIHLDGKPVKTPKRTPLALSHRALAEAVAEEWAAQADTIEMDSMPLTRLANTAMELAEEHRAKAAEQILAFGKSDLLCYRAEGPDELVRRQAAAWDPLLAWSERELGARLATGQGIAFVAQPVDAFAALGKAVLGHDSFGLVALHSATVITGSLVLALAIAKGRLGAQDAFELSRVDEAYQAEKWGRDTAADARAARLAAELAAAERFLRLASNIHPPLESTGCTKAIPRAS